MIGTASPVVTGRGLQKRKEREQRGAQPRSFQEKQEMGIFGLAECICPDMACVILVACHTVIVAAVVSAIDAGHRRKLAEMERIALDLARENAELKRKKNEVPLSEMQAATQGKTGIDGKKNPMPDLRPEDAASLPTGSGGAEAVLRPEHELR